MASGDWHFATVCISEGTNHDYAVYVGLAGWSEQMTHDQGQKLPSREGRAFMEALVHMGAAPWRLLKLSYRP